MSQTQRAVFPGSFDPLTNGHVDIIERSLSIFDQVIVAVLCNPEKSTLFSIEERVWLIESHFKSFGEKVKVESFTGLLVDFVRSVETGVVIRGLRAISDYDYEAQIALMNKNLCEEIETFFLMTRERNSYISSRLVKQVAMLNGDVKNFVPQIVEKALHDKLKVNKR